MKMIHSSCFHTSHATFAFVAQEAEGNSGSQVVVVYLSAVFALATATAVFVPRVGWMPLVCVNVVLFELCN
jgi:hypothetical protein